MPTQRKFHRHPALDDLTYGQGPAVYAVELDSGVVKVGHSFNPKTRLYHLTGDIRRRLAARIARVHIGAANSDSVRGCEQAVLARLRKVGAQQFGTAREYFVGVGFDEVVRVIDEQLAA